MSNGATIRFSQSSLSAYAQCPRRFWLRYVCRVEWPAPLSEEMAVWERAVERGAQFHHWMHQDSIGVGVDAWALECGDEMLVRWWKNWLQTPAELPAGVVYSEVQLSVPLLSRRLVAQYDRIVAAADGRIYIGDWKTGQRVPDATDLAASWQTWVYRFVAVEAGAMLNGGRAVRPEDVVLVYWHANAPAALEPISYSAREHDEARAKIEGTLAEIGQLPREESAFPMTEDGQVCKRCSYASLCQRAEGRCEVVDIEDDERGWDNMPEDEW